MNFADADELLNVIKILHKYDNYLQIFKMFLFILFSIFLFLQYKRH